LGIGILIELTPRSSIAHTPVMELATIWFSLIFKTQFFLFFFYANKQNKNRIQNSSKREKYVSLLALVRSSCQLGLEMKSNCSIFLIKCAVKEADIGERNRWLSFVNNIGVMSIFLPIDKTGNFETEWQCVVLVYLKVEIFMSTFLMYKNLCKIFIVSVI